MTHESGDLPCVFSTTGGVSGTAVSGILVFSEKSGVQALVLLLSY